jgi:hypothetical protein
MEDVAVPAKTFKVPTCRDQCYLALLNTEGIFEKYKNVGSYDKQNLYLQGLITVTGERRQTEQSFFAVYSTEQVFIT